jgi:hypothetical protein
MISNAINAFLLPLVMWGMLSSLLLQLIALRETFIAGGATKMRLATLAFALGVVLIQRLAVQQGRSTARAYGAFLGLAILLFLLYDAMTWVVPANPGLVFLLNLAFLGVLWWAGHKITAACAADGNAARVSAETGIFSRTQNVASLDAVADLPAPADAGESDPDNLAPPEADEELLAPYDVRSIYDRHNTDQRELRKQRRREREAEKQKQTAGPDWSRRLGGPHPGRALLYFALFAVPAFGFGSLAMAGDTDAQILAGIRLFIYLWCSLTLLWLASLGQLRVYFEYRKVTLPDVTGIAWIVIGSVVVLGALTVAFLLPQPASPGAGFVRQRLQATFEGWQDERGLRDEGGGESGRRSAKQKYEQWEQQRYDAVDRLNDEQISQTARQRENRTRAIKALGLSNDQVFGELFDGFLRLLFILLVIGMLLAFYALVMFGVGSLGRGLEGFRRAAARRKPRRRRDKQEEAEQPGGRSFSKFTDPFYGAGALTDGDALVRYLWIATLAFCADRGAACPPDATPREFVDAGPEPLSGMLDQARWLADLFCFSEFSGQRIDTASRSRLKEYWTALQRQAASA